MAFLLNDAIWSPDGRCLLFSAGAVGGPEKLPIQTPPITVRRHQPTVERPTHKSSMPSLRQEWSDASPAAIFLARRKPKLKPSGLHR